MFAWIIFYDMNTLAPKERTKALEELFGKTKTSHGGKYTHTIKPKFSRYIRPVRAAIIVQKGDVEQAKNFLSSYGVPYRACKIEIGSADFENSRFF